MKAETYKQAHKIQEQITKLKYELEVLKQSYEKQTSIRFGTEYNVTIPIVFNEAIYTYAVCEQMGFHISMIQQLETEFNEL